MKLKKLSKPEEIVRLTLEKWSNKTGQEMKNVDNYILQVIGMNDFLYGDYELVMYKVLFIINTIFIEHHRRKKFSSIESGHITLIHYTCAYRTASII